MKTTMKKKFLSMICIALLAASLAACGNEEANTPGTTDVAKLEDYTEIPFSIYLGEGESATSFTFAKFPVSWNGNVYDTIDYYEYFRKNYALGGMEVPVVWNQLPVKVDFGGYHPDRITVTRDLNTFDVLSAKETPSEENITEVTFDTKNDSFVVEYGENDMAYYIIRCEWDNVGVVNYAVVFSQK